MLGVPPSVPSNAKLQSALLEQRPHSQIIGDGTQNQDLVIWKSTKWQQLTHWPLGYVEVILGSITMKIVIQSSSLIIQKTITLHSGKKVNIGSCNGMESPDNKPLLEPRCINWLQPWSLLNTLRSNEWSTYCRQHFQINLVDEKFSWWKV